MNFAPFAFRQQVSTAPAFNPNNLSDLTFWVDMSDSNFYTTSGSNITEIYSKVGGSTNTTLTRVNASNGYYQLEPSLSNSALNSAKVTSRPTTYRSSTWNNGVAADATFGPKTNTTDYPDGSMFVVYNRGTISTAGYLISRYNGSTDRGVQYNLATGSPNTDTIGYDFNSPAYQYYNTTTRANNILARVNNGATSSIYKNGVLQTSGAKNDTQNLTTRQFHNLGIYGSPTGTGDSTPINTQYCEIIIYNRVLSASEITQVTNYLSNKWNIPLPSVPTNGLMAWLDASNSTSYPGSGTTWFDISGNNRNFTLTNGPTYSSLSGGTITFDGSNDYAVYTGSTGIAGNNGPVSMVYIGRWTNTGGDRIAQNITINDTGGTAAANMGMRSSTHRLERAGGTQLVSFNSAPVVNAFNMWSATLTGSTGFTYTGATQVGSTTTAAPQTTAVNAFYVGTYFRTATNQFAGQIGVALWYNRILSLSEISEIYNFYKTNYGLP